MARLSVNLPYSLTRHAVEALSDGKRRELSIQGIEVRAVASGLRAKLDSFGSDQDIDGCIFSCEQQFGL